MVKKQAQFLDALADAEVDRVRRLLSKNSSLATESFPSSLTTNPPLLVAVRVPGFAGHGEEISADAAADEERAEIVEVLIEHGADPNLRSRGGVRPLHMAARYGLARCIRSLVVAGAEVDVRNAKGETPLYRAANLGHRAAVQELLRLGASVSVVSNKGEGPLERARRKGLTEIVELLRPGR